MCLEGQRLVQEIRQLKAKRNLNYIEIYPYMNLILYGNDDVFGEQYEMMFETEEELNWLLDELDKLQINYKEYND